MFLRRTSLALALCLFLDVTGVSVTRASFISSVTVAAKTIESWRYGGATAKLRVYASETFDQSGSFVIGSARGSGKWYKEVDCAISGTSLLIPAFTLYVTTTSNRAFASYTFVFVDSRGVERDVYLSEIRVPDTLGAAVSWSQLVTYNSGAQKPANPTYPSMDQVSALLAQAAQGVLKETPAGTIDGSNQTFTLTRTPITDSEVVFLNGVAQTKGSLGNGTESYTISGTTITHNLPPQTGDSLLVVYRINAGLITDTSAITANDPRLGLSVLDYGAAADAVAIEDATISLSTPTTLSSATGGLNSATVGKVIVVAGAGASGATLITTVIAAPTPNTLTLASAATTAVTNTRAVYGTNNTAAFQAALNAAASHEQTRTVYAPKGNYLFSTGSLTVPQGVSLIGANQSASDSMGYRYSDEIKPMSGKGATLVVAANEGTSTGRFIFLNSNSVLRGVCIFHPSQLASLVTPKVYPWSVEMFGTAPTVENVEVLNSYQGIYSHIGQRHTVRNVRGTPILTGLYVSQQLETSRYSDITFVPIYTFSTTEVSPFPHTNLMDWVSKNGTAFKIGKVDNGVFYNCFTFDYFKGFKFVIDASEVTTYANGTGAPGGKAWAQIISSGADSCSYPVDIDDVAGADNSSVIGVTFTNCIFAASQWNPFAGPELYGFYARSTFTGRVGIHNSQFHLGTVNIVNAATAGRLTITGNYFQSWTVKAIDVNGTATITGNTFKTGNPAPVIVSVASGANAVWLAVDTNVFEYQEHLVYSVHADARFDPGDGNVYSDSPKQTAVTFQNGWVDFGGAFQGVSYTKKGGRVCLRGTAKNGTIGLGVPVFTAFPVGFRPPANLVFAVPSNSVLGVVSVESSGVVSVTNGNNASVSFDGICFSTR